MPLWFITIIRSFIFELQSQDLGEFEAMKKFMVIGVPLAAYLMITQVKEFLAVRAAGLLALMGIGFRQFA